MGLPRKKVGSKDEWISAFTAEQLSGKSRIWLLTRAIAGELVAKVEAGRALILRSSLDQLMKAQ